MPVAVQESPLLFEGHLIFPLIIRYNSFLIVFALSKKVLKAI
jgi:hypothetical protein